MNTQEKYDALINLIEEKIALRQAIETQEIVEEIETSSLLDKRAIGEVFKFLTGVPLVRYIERRQIMAAYRFLAMRQGSMEAAIDFTDISNSSSFCKKFKQVFGLTPKEVTLRGDMTGYEDAATWIQISGHTLGTTEKEMNSMTETLKQLDLSPEKLDLYNDLKGLQTVYGFNDDEMLASYQLAQAHNISLSQAFWYIRAGISAYENTKLHEAKKTILKVQFYAEQILYLKSKTSLSDKQADYLVYLLDRSCIADIREEPIDALEEYIDRVNTFRNYNDFKRLYDYFKRHCIHDDWIEEYFKFIADGYDPKSALAKTKEFYDDIDAMMDSFDDNTEVKFDDFYLDMEDEEDQESNNPKRSYEYYEDGVLIDEQDFDF